MQEATSCYNQRYVLYYNRAKKELETEVLRQMGQRGQISTCVRENSNPSKKKGGKKTQKYKNFIEK